jgi:hypothetical protein
MKNFHKILLVFTVLHVFFPSALAGEPYSDLAFALFMDIRSLLVEHRVCENINQCQKQRRISSGGTPNQANVRVYKAGDLNSAAIQDIVKLCLDVYAVHARKQGVTLKIYRETAEEANAWFSHARPFIYLELKGDS